MKKIIILILIQFAFSCRQEEQAEESHIRDLFYATVLKTSECGNSPKYFIFPFYPLTKKDPLSISGKVPKDFVPSKKDTNNCTLAIIQQKCPFKEYPLNCLLLFKNFELGIKFENPLGKDKK